MGRFQLPTAALAAAFVLLVPGVGTAAPKPGPALAITPSTNGNFDYGTVDPGQAVSQAFTVTNVGGAASGRLSISLTGSGAFTKTADACTATSLKLGKSCSVTVQYAPTVPGQADTATLTAVESKRGATATVALSGTGRAAATAHVYWTNFDLGLEVPRMRLIGEVDATAEELFLGDADRDAAITRARDSKSKRDACADAIRRKWEQMGQPAVLDRSSFAFLDETYDKSAIGRARSKLGMNAEATKDERGAVAGWVWRFPGSGNGAL